MFLASTLQVICFFHSIELLSQGFVDFVVVLALLKDVQCAIFSSCHLAELAPKVYGTYSRMIIFISECHGTEIRPNQSVVCDTIASLSLAYIPMGLKSCCLYQVIS